MSGDDVSQHVCSMWHAATLEEGTQWKANFVITVSTKNADGPH